MVPYENVLFSAAHKRLKFTIQAPKQNLKIIPVKGIRGRCLSVWGPLLSKVLFGAVWQFCRFWICSDTEFCTPGEYGIQQDSAPSHPQPHAPCLHILYFDTGKGGREGGRVEPERRLECQQFTKLGRKYQHDWMYLQSINSDKHLPQSRFTGQLF